MWIDYPNKKLMLRKCAALTGGFEYNMSGLDIVYNGEELVKEMDPEKVISYSGPNSMVSKTIAIPLHFRRVTDLSSSPLIAFPKSCRIHLLHSLEFYPDDILLKINGNSVHDLSIGQLIKKLQTKDGKKIRVTIRRGEDILKFQFKLKKRV